MSWWNFFRLIREIYWKPVPDLMFIQRLGLLAVKIGQVHALRVDFLDEARCEHLAKLYRQTASIPAEDVEALITAYAAPGFRDNFSSFDATPFASASVGQVHRARLKGGEDVAVKIVKRDFTKTFEHDVRSVQRLFRLLTAVYPKLRGVANPVGLLQGIEKTTLSELDLRNERAGHELLERIAREQSAAFDLSHLAFARVYPDLSNEHILVSSLLPGPTFDELIERRELSYDQLLELFHIHGFYMFVVGTFHGDIHPGNIIVQDGKIYFLDTGYIGNVSARIRTNLFFFFDALGKYDYVRCARYLNAMSEIELSGKPYERFERAFLDLYADFKGKTVSEVSLTTKMMHTIKLGVVSGMRFEEGMFDIIKSLMYMDGMVLRVNPNAVLLEDMQQFIREFSPLIDRPAG